MVFSVLCFIVPKGGSLPCRGKGFAMRLSFPFLIVQSPFQNLQRGRFLPSAGSLLCRGEILAMREQFPFLMIYPCQLPSEENVITIHSHLLWAVALVASEEFYCTEYTWSWLCELFCGR